jgi:cytochrome P450
MQQIDSRSAPAAGSSLSGPVRLLRRIKLALGILAYRVQCYALSHPGLFLVPFAVLRRLRPIAKVGNLMVVTKDCDVREVLDRFDDFTMHEVLGPGMPWGPFMITIDWRQQHDLERKLMQSAVKVDADVAAIKSAAKRVAGRLIDEAGSAAGARGEIDVVAGLIEPVMVEVAADYFGIRRFGSGDPTMAQIYRHLASLIMVRPPEGSHDLAASLASIDAVTAELVRIIREKQAIVAAGKIGADLGDDLISRLVALLAKSGGQPPWFDADWIKRYAIGLAATGGATIVRATTHTVDQLLAHPEGLAIARERARLLNDAEAEQNRLAGMPGTPKDKIDAAGQAVEEARARLRQVIYEALRFRPMLQLLVRYVPRETVLAKGTRRMRTAPPGSTVLAAPLAAMFDPERFEHPWHFVPDRDLASYIHFGYGLRECFGRYVAEVIRGLLRLPDLKRASGRRGRVGYEGPAAKSLYVTFDNRSAR